MWWVGWRWVIEGRFLERGGFENLVWHRDIG